MAKQRHRRLGTVKAVAKPYKITRLNQRSPGPSGEFDTWKEALVVVEAWIASMTHMGSMMAGMAGIQILGPTGVEWCYRTLGLALLMATASPCFADYPASTNLTPATVVRVVNGDTLDVFVPKFQKQLRVQLASADAIEYPQDSADNERLLTSSGCPPEAVIDLHGKAVSVLETLLNKEVVLEDAGPKDVFDRYPVFLWVGDHLVNKDLLSTGLAVYRPYQSSPYDPQLQASMIIAQSQRLGLWRYVQTSTPRFNLDPRSRPSGAVVNAGQATMKGTITGIDEADGYIYLELDRSQCVKSNRSDLVERVRGLKRGQTVEVDYTVENGKSLLKKLRLVTE